VSVTASDDIDTRSTTATDPSVTEQDQNAVDEKTSSSPKNVSPTTSRGPVQLLRRQLTMPNTPTQSPSRQATPTSGDGRQPSPTRIEQTSPKESIDPSILEAFANPMNRQYLLQLEGSLNNFVTQTRFKLIILR
jgi:hypothetical protein